MTTRPIIDPHEFIKGKMVSGVTPNGEEVNDTIDITFQDEVKKLQLYAKAECCSESMFSNVPDLTTMVGKEISGINDEEESSPPRYDKESNGCKREGTVTISFNDGSSLEIKLVNYSNGYYSGWLELFVK